MPNQSLERLKPALPFAVTCSVQMTRSLPGAPIQPAVLAGCTSAGLVAAAGGAFSRLDRKPTCSVSGNERGITYG
jgi:hypothetical protein